ncbi:hypothetical protein UC34_24795 (plasmid) [Pandoraea vervacti]|uniref:Uncharacterized protein n=1 Tax=Pandoraea vervacti TaxID=656178 RepID=A0ABM5T5B7_9BURK|nr:hypothetical protein [Pandoraea vervacti]AJP60137.1 hypothetical protein UC34_24795 [Pandoraea vervacti]
MPERSLGAVRVAVLLISASCGVGFLFGSGEMALSAAMAGMGGDNYLGRSLTIVLAGGEALEAA